MADVEGWDKPKWSHLPSLPSGMRIADNLKVDLPFLEISEDQIREAVQEPDKKNIIDLELLEGERRPHALRWGKNTFIYLILKKSPSEKFYLLLICFHNEGEEILVTNAFKVTEGISKKIDTKSPYQVLVDLTTCFGLPMVVDGEERRILIQMEIIAKEGEEIKFIEVKVPKGHSAIFQSVIKVVDDGKRIIAALKFALDMSTYQEWLYANKLSHSPVREKDKKTEQVKPEYRCKKCDAPISPTDEKCPNGHVLKEVGKTIKLLLEDSLDLTARFNVRAPVRLTSYIPNTTNENKALIINNLNIPEGTFSFIGKYDTLWDEPQKGGVLFQVITGRKLFLLRKDKDFITFCMSSPETGTRIVGVDAKQLEGITQLQFFMTWSHEEIRLYVGSKEGAEVFLTGEPMKSKYVFFVEEDGYVVIGERGE